MDVYKNMKYVTSISIVLDFFFLFSVLVSERVEKVCVLPKANEGHSYFIPIGRENKKRISTWSFL